MRTRDVDTQRRSLANRLRWLSGEGAFYLALASAALLLVSYVVVLVDALGGAFSYREPGFRPAYALSWFLAALSAVTSAVGGVCAARAVREGRRSGWGIAAGCIAVVVLPLSVTLMVAQARTS